MNTRMTMTDRTDPLPTWLAAQAESLDAQAVLAPELLPRLAQAGWLGCGVRREWGGQGGSVWEAVEGIADVAAQSLTAAFTLWSQRAFMECLLQSDNAPLRESLLPSLLQGTLAGAVGLSNGMKYLSGLEATAIRATPGQSDARWHLDGQVPWCTNVRP